MFCILLTTLTIHMNRWMLFELNPFEKSMKIKWMLNFSYFNLIALLHFWMVKFYLQLHTFNISFFDCKLHEVSPRLVLDRSYKVWSWQQWSALKLPKSILSKQTKQKTQNEYEMWPVLCFVLYTFNERGNIVNCILLENKIFKFSYNKSHWQMHSTICIQNDDTSDDWIHQ